MAGSQQLPLDNELKMARKPVNVNRRQIPILSADIGWQQARGVLIFPP